jgi:hypothetical protein
MVPELQVEALGESPDDIVREAERILKAGEYGRVLRDAVA